MRKLYLALFLSMLWAGMALAETIDGITYTLNPSTSTATVTNTPSGSVVIPATVKYNNRTYNVTAISGVSRSGIISIEIPSTVERIENDTFRNMESLVNVNLSEGLSFIGDFAFEGCEALTSITVPTTVLHIGEGAFRDCTSLTKIVWNAKHCADFVSASDAPFNYRPSGYVYQDEPNYKNDYTTSIIFGDEVEYIPAYLCYNFIALTTLAIPQNVKEIGAYAFHGFYYDNSLNKRYDTNLTSVTFGSGLERIGLYAFYGRRNLAAITTPNNCTTIESKAFGECNKISSITFGKNISVIGTNAFTSSSITTINIYAMTPPVITKSVFLNVNYFNLITLNVPSKAIDAYKTSTVWKDMSIKAMSSDQRTFTLSLSSADESMGTTTPGGMYDEDSEVLIYAAAKDGYKFSKWNDGNAENPRTVKMIGDLSYTAQFEAYTPVPQYTITASANAVEGTAIGGGVYESGAQVTLAAVGNTGYHFAQWTDGNQSNPRQITVTADGSYVAQFAKDAEIYTLTTSSTNVAQGTAYGQGKYEEGTSVAIFAVANDGYHFTQWHDGNTENPRMVNVSKDAMFFANFAQDPVGPTLYEVKIKPANAAQGWTTEGGSFELGTQIMVYAHPAEGFEFSQWSDGNTENPRFLTVTSAMNLTAMFKVETPNSISSTKVTPSEKPVRKFVRDGKVFIEYGDRTYTIQGTETK